MFFEAGSNQKPHLVPYDVLRTPHGTPRLNLAHLPHAKTVQPRFDYEKFFSLMGVIEEGHNQFDQLEYIEERPTVPGSERVSESIITNRKWVDLIIKHIGGIPVRFMSEDGLATHGRVLEASNLIRGKWELLLQNDSAHSTVYHSTQEIRNGFLAATATSSEISTVIPVTDSEQIA
jgi:hypothetical protein